MSNIFDSMIITISLILLLLSLLTVHTVQADELSAPIIRSTKFPSAWSAATTIRSSASSLKTPFDYYWNRNNYPNPLKNPYGCRQPKKSLLCDPDQILEQNHANQLRQLLEQNQQKSKKCFCKVCPQGEYGIKIAIALAKNIDTTTKTNTSSDTASQMFADHLRNRWQYSLCNDSILLLLIESYPSNKQSSITTSTGQIAARIFEHQFFADIIANHSLKSSHNDASNQYFELLKSLVTAISKHVEAIDDPRSYLQDGPTTKSVETNHHDDGHGETGTALIVVAVIVGFIFFLSFLILTVVYWKKRYEHDETDSRLPPMQTPPSPPEGYHSVSVTDNDTDTNNNDNKPKSTMVPMAVDDEDLSDIDEGDEGDSHENNDDHRQQQQQQQPQQHEVQDK